MHGRRPYFDRSSGPGSMRSAPHGCPASPGIFSAHPGADDDALRWLAFETFSGRRAPHVKTASVDRVRAALPVTILEQLRAFERYLTTRSALPARLLTGPRGRSRTCRPMPAGMRRPKRLSLPTRASTASCLLEVNPGGTGRLSAQRTAQTAAGIRAELRAAAHVELGRGSAQRLSCRITTAHDRVVNAAALADRARTRASCGRSSTPT